MSSAPVTILRASCGTVLAPPANRWAADAETTDHLVLGRAVPPVLDVGCGPGRHTVALAQRGVAALGIDVTPGALTVARGRGASVLERSVFDRIPGAGRWGCALLLDGNLGIGGRPGELLARLAELLAPTGRVLVELDPPGTPTQVRRVRLEVGTRTGPWFDWVPVAADRVAPLARPAGFAVCERWSHGERHFAQLERR